MTMLETLIFTQIGSVGARDVPFHYETILHNTIARQNIGLSNRALKETPLLLTGSRVLALYARARVVR